MATVIRELLVRFGVKANNRAVKTFEANVDRAKGAMKAAAAAAAGFAAALGVREIAETAENVTNLAAAFKQLGGTEEELARLRESTKGLVSDDTLMRMSNMASLFGIAGDQVDQLSEIAVGASVATGESVEKMFEDILTASSRQSAMIADNLGILVKAGAANDAMAKKLKKSVNELTGAEKQRAFVEALIAGGARQRALASKLEATEVAKLKTETRNLFVQFSLLMRKALVPLIRIITGRFLPAIKKLLNGIDAWINDTERVTKALKVLGTVGEFVAVIIATIVTVKVLGGFASLAQTVTGAAIAFRRLGLMATIAQAKIFIIPLAIGALILALQDMFVWLKGGDSLTGRFIDRWAQAPGTLGTVARALQSVKPQLQSLLNDPSAGFGAIGVVVKKSVGVAVSFIEGVLIPLFPVALEAVRSFLIPMAEEFMASAKVLIDAFAGVLPGIKSTLMQIFKATKGIFGDVVRLVFGQARLYGTLIRSGLPVAVRLIAAVVKVVRALMPVLKVVIGAPFILAKKAFDLILPLVLRGIEVIIPIIESVAEKITEVMDDSMPAVIEFVDGAVKIIKAMAKFIIKVFVSLRDDFWTPLWAGMGVAVDVIKSTLSGVMDFVRDIIGGIGDVLGLAGDAVTAVKNIAPELFGSDIVDPDSDAGRAQRTAGGVFGAPTAEEAAGLADFNAGAAALAASAARRAEAERTQAAQTNIGEINVTVQGSTDMGPADMSKAVEQGTTTAMLKQAGREASNG